LTFTLQSSLLTDFGTYTGAVSVTAFMVTYPAVTTTFGFNIDVLQHPCILTSFSPVAPTDMVTTARDGLQVVQVLGKLPLLNDPVDCGLLQIDVTYTGVNPPTLISHVDDATNGLTFTLQSSLLTDFGTYTGAVSVTAFMLDYVATTVTFGFNIDVLQHPCFSEAFPP